MLLAFGIGTSLLFAPQDAAAAGAIEGEFKLGEVLDAVSYTHLTLPTICSV